MSGSVRRRAALLVALHAGLAFGLAGCSHYQCEDCNVPPRNDRGPRLATDAAGAAGGLTFTAGGDEVVYVAQGPGDPLPVLRAVSVNGGGRRVVDGGHPAPGGMLAPLADGSALYYVAAVGDGPVTYVLREAYSGTDVPLDPPPAPGLLLASPSGEELLVQQGEGAVLLDLETGATAPIPCGAPAAFSPAGDAVLCATPDGALVRVALAGQELPALVEIPDAGRARAVSWSEGGMRAAFSPALVVADPGTGVILDDRRAGVGPSMAFTPGGGALAFVTSGMSWGGYEARVLVLDLATGQAGSVAVASAGPYVPRLDPENILLAIARDGARAAYTFGHDLHVRDVAR